MNMSAVRYAELGYRVFPCRPWTKEPATHNGVLDGTTEIERVGDWWIASPAANIGLATDNLLVLDVDGGINNPWLTEKRKASLDETAGAIAQTPRGGFHYIYRRPEERNWKCSTGKIALNIDVKTTGGYIVACPSRVVDVEKDIDGTYEWLVPLEDGPANLPEPPEWLQAELDRIGSPDPAPRAATANEADGHGKIPQGQRNTTLTSLAGSMRRRGMSDEAVDAALQAENLQRCSPPLPVDEVASIVRSIGKYASEVKSPIDTSGVQLLIEKLAPTDSPASVATKPSERSGFSVLSPSPMRRERPEPWVPYPVEVLPAPIRSYVQSLAAATHTEEGTAALASLAVASVAIGGSRAIQLKRRWQELPSLWVVVVAEQGAGKSPAVRETMRPLHARQQAERDEFARRRVEHEEDLARYEQARKRCDKDIPIADRPRKPVLEPMRRHIVSDTTMEALCSVLDENPRGLLLDGDELSAWLGGMDRYTGAHVDAANWRRIFDSNALTVDRKKDREQIFVRYPLVSIIGTIQPGVLQRALGSEHLESGLAARLLFAYPPNEPSRWSDADLPGEIEARYTDLIARLLELEPQVDANGRPEPMVVPLNEAARQRFIGWYNGHRQEQTNLTGVLSGHWSKLVAYCARFALIIWLIRQADGELVGFCVDEAAVEAAIRLVEWHKREAIRVYDTFGETDEERRRRTLVEWIEKRGGATTARDLARGPREYRSPGYAEAALEELVKVDWGQWELIPPASQGGRPSRVFRLAAGGDGDTTPNNLEEDEGFVAADMAEWGWDGAEHARQEVADVLAQAQAPGDETSDNSENNEGSVAVATANDSSSVPEALEDDQWGEL